MLKIYEYKALDNIAIDALTIRNTDSNQEVADRVREILEMVQTEGDRALNALGQQYDGIETERLYLESDEIESIASRIGRAEQRSLEIAFANIHRFHAVQTKRERRVETMPGVNCWREFRPIEKVGLYVPGGSAVLPSTLLMLGVPARIAGCREIVVCTPPRPDGIINPFVAYCLRLLHIERVYLTGGAQAIAAMAYGTETVPRVDKIFGPGNQYVTQAKRILQSETQVAIDLPAGPSEVLIIADESANPVYIAADLLAQSEHGADSQAVLVSPDQELIGKINAELKHQIVDLPRKEIAQKALSNSYALRVGSLDEALAFSNRYAPEHLILATAQYQTLVSRILNAGSVFLGHLSAESFGDYASGTNHTLPTSGYARAYSGASVDSFVKKITFQHINAEGLRALGPTVEILAGMEGLEAHGRAVRVRLEELYREIADGGSTPV